MFLINWVHKYPSVNSPHNQKKQLLPNALCGSPQRASARRKFQPKACPCWGICCSPALVIPGGNLVPLKATSKKNAQKLSCVTWLSKFEHVWSSTIFTQVGMYKYQIDLQEKKKKRVSFIGWFAVYCCKVHVFPNPSMSSKWEKKTPSNLHPHMEPQTSPPHHPVASSPLTIPVTISACP